MGVMESNIWLSSTIRKILCGSNKREGVLRKHNLIQREDVQLGGGEVQPRSKHCPDWRGGGGTEATGRPHTKQRAPQPQKLWLTSDLLWLFSRASRLSRTHVQNHSTDGAELYLLCKFRPWACCLTAWKEDTGTGSVIKHRPSRVCGIPKEHMLKLTRKRVLPLASAFLSLWKALWFN